MWPTLNFTGKGKLKNGTRYLREDPRYRFCTRSVEWFRPRVRKSRYWGETPIHCCDVTKPPYMFSGELCTSPLHYKRLFVYTVCCRRAGHCVSVLRTRKSDVVDSTGRRYVIEQGHNVPLLRTRGLGFTFGDDQTDKHTQIHRLFSKTFFLMWEWYRIENPAHTCGF